MTSEGNTAAAVLDRRSFLRLVTLAGGGLTLAICIGKLDVLAADAPLSAATPAEFQPDVFLRLAPDGTVTILCKKAEMGQGTRTALPMIVAEELGADWSRVRVEQSPVDPDRFGTHSTGGSNSVYEGWDRLRRAGAVMRTMLVSAAAAEWGAPENDCAAEQGAVVHKPSGRRLEFGALSTRAAKLPVPALDKVALKNRSEFSLLGRRIGGVDNRDIVTGRLRYGIDQKRPGMLHAAYQKCPAFGGRVKSANVDELKALPGVRDAFVLEAMPTRRWQSGLAPGVAILADSTWAAFNALDSLKVDWDESAAAKDSWSAALAQARAASPDGGEAVHAAGDASAKLREPGVKRLSAQYAYPFIAHATMEPQNCTAAWHGDRVELWAPTQEPAAGREDVALAFGIPQENVTVHLLRSGGGFGRRLCNDYMIEAAVIARRAGVPVNLLWTREQDFARDFYRPGGVHHMQGGVDAAGRLVAWKDHFVSFRRGNNPVAGGGFNSNTRAPQNTLPAPLLADCTLSMTLLPTQIPCGWWRAPSDSIVAWVTQSFLHELSAAAGRDHVEFLLELLGEPRWLRPGDVAALHTGRAAAVIKLAAEKSGWGTPLPPGRGRGIAFHFSYRGHVAHVAEVDVDKDRGLRVHRVVAAADVGPVVNRSGAENQVQGAAIDAISVLCLQGLAIEGGRVQESNFHEYGLLRHRAAPRVEAHFIESDFPPTGLGEPAFPSVAPAVCNAIFAACGHRVRSLPLVAEGFKV